MQKKEREREHSSILTLNPGIGLLCENGYVAFWNENPQIAQFQQIPKTLAFPRLYLVVYLVRSFLLAG